MPTTFVLNPSYQSSETHNFVQRFTELAMNNGMSLKERMPQKHCFKNVWLVKPAAMNQGRGIQFFTKLLDIMKFVQAQPAHSYWVVQKYIERPLLFRGRKFDIRIWVLVTHPNEVYIYRDGYLRTSSTQFDLKDGNLYVHLTNNCLQQKGDQYSLHEAGNTLSFSEFQRYLDS